MAADPETPRSDQPRDDLGRFTPTSTEEEQQVEEAPVAEETPGEEQARLYAGRYKTLEELEAAHESLNRKIGEQGAELGQYRQQQQEQPAPQYDLSGAEDAVLENPAVAPQLLNTAYAQGDTIAYERTLRAWAEVDAVSANRYEAQRIAYESQQQIQPQLQKIDAYESRNALEQNLGNVLSKHEDAAHVLASLDPTVHEIPRLITAGIQSPDPGLQADAGDALYQHAKGLNGATASAAATQAAAEHQQQARTAKTQAAVASSSTAPASVGTGQKSFEEQFLADILEPSPFGSRI